VTELRFRALPGLGIVSPGDDLVPWIRGGLEAAEITLAPGDVIVIASKAVSRAEGRFRDLGATEVSAKAAALAAEVDKDPRLVEWVLRESVAVSRKKPGVLVVRHRLGLVSANAAIDQSNAQPPDASDSDGPWILLLPQDPDRTAQALSQALGVAVVITDSLGRPFRLGSQGTAIGCAGLAPLVALVGQEDLFGRPLEHTAVGVADAIAAAADLVAGQAGEGRAVVHVRGLVLQGPFEGAAALVRPPHEDLYA
jgi:coenzyme F420-0:L-glutamate ligase/coenzyme F420-1:gamma-L-glutamate ligase